MFEAAASVIPAARQDTPARQACSLSTHEAAGLRSRNRDGRVTRVRVDRDNQFLAEEVPPVAHQRVGERQLTTKADDRLRALPMATPSVKFREGVRSNSPKSWVSRRASLPSGGPGTRVTKVSL